MIAPREAKKRPDGGRSVRPNGPGKGLGDRFEDAGREQRLGWRGRAERPALVAGEGKAASRNRLLLEWFADAHRRFDPLLAKLAAGS